MPGVLTTTSQRESASHPPAAVERIGSPPASPWLGWSSGITGAARIAKSLRRLAPPSTPRPHTPTEAPARSDQQILGREVIGDVVGVVGREQPSDVGRRDRRELRGQPLKQVVVSPVAPLGGQGRPGAALPELV